MNKSRTLLVLSLLSFMSVEATANQRTIRRRQLRGTTAAKGGNAHQQNLQTSIREIKGERLLGTGTSQLLTATSRTKVVIQSWLDVERVDRQIVEFVDPWRATFSGLPAKVKATFTRQRPSRPIEIADGERPLAGPHLRRALRKSLRFQSFHRAQLTPSGVERKDVVDIADEIPIHTPVRVTYRNPNTGRKESIGTNVVGHPEAVLAKHRSQILVNSGIVGSTEITTTTETVRTGLVQTHYRPWVQPANVFVTPPLVDSKTGDGKATLLGLGAFPVGATISLKNLRTGDVTSKLASTTTGSARLQIPVKSPFDLLELVVAYPGRAQESHRQSVRYQLTTADTQSASVRKYGPDYYRARMEEVEGELGGTFTDRATTTTIRLTHKGTSTTNAPHTDHRIQINTEN